MRFSFSLFEAAVPHPSLEIRIPFLLLGIVVMCFGSSLYIVGDLGVSAYDAVALILAEKKVARFQYCRIGSDLICTITGFLPGAVIGIGTVVTALFLGSIIAFFNERISKPFRYGADKNRTVFVKYNKWNGVKINVEMSEMRSGV